MRARARASDLAAFPATPDDHHSYAGGLLEHTVGVATLARETAQLHPRLRGDLLLAAALVHDCGRTLELSRGPAFAPTDEGRLLGHVHLGLRLIEQHADGLDRRAARRAPALRRGAPRRARGTDGRGGRALPREPARRDRRDATRGVTAVLLALGASLAWGVADFVGPWKARTLGHAAGAAVGAGRRPRVRSRSRAAVRANPPDDWAVLLAVPAALSGTLGLYAYYRGMQTGMMSVVAPIAGASAIVPVVFGIATGDRPSAVPARRDRVRARRRRARRAGAPGGGERRVAAGVWLALLAAIGFGFYFPPMHAAGEADPWWASLDLPHDRAADRRRRRGARGARTCASAAGRSGSSLAVGVGDTLGNLLFAASASTGSSA